MNKTCPHCKGSGQIEVPDPPRCEAVINGHRCTMFVHKGNMHQPSLFTVAQEAAVRASASEP